jgi:hypothetical protein
MQTQTDPTGASVHSDKHPETTQKCRRCGDYFKIKNGESPIFCSKKCSKEAADARQGRSEPAWV